MDVTRRDPATLLEAGHAIAAALRAAATDDEIYPPLLATLARTFDWSVAAAWEPDAAGDLRCRAISSLAPGRTHAFVAATEALRLAEGAGLPGRVWSSGNPVWITDLATDPDFPRADAARAAGLVSALAFLVAGGEGRRAVIEVFSADPRTPDDHLIRTVRGFGEQIGLFLDLRDARAALAASESRARAVVDAALDAIVMMDGGGTIVGFNPAAERTFGWSRDEVLGREMGEVIIPPSLRERHRVGLSDHLRTGGERVMGRRIEVPAIHRDGHEFPVELTITRIDTDGSALFAGFIRDITDRVTADRELRQSRARIVAAADAERRRIERNLHDGAQQHIVTLLLSLRLGRSLVDDTSEVAAIIDAAIEQAGIAGEEMRELARGIHPALLTKRGLVPALEALAARAPLPVALTVDDAGRLPDAVEAAAYYVTTEAVTNAAKYADASEVQIHLARAGSSVVLTIRDDGRGGADPAAGSGLVGLRDRVEALGGALAVESPAGAGTLLRVEMPCAL